jgi:hypothetical protein
MGIRPFRTILLTNPQVSAIRVCSRPDDIGWTGPRTVGVDLVANNDTKAFVVLEEVFKQAASHKLIKQLSERELEALRKIFFDDGVGLIDNRERGSVRLIGNKDGPSHREPRNPISAYRTIAAGRENIAMLLAPLVYNLRIASRRPQKTCRSQIVCNTCNSGRF